QALHRSTRGVQDAAFATLFEPLEHGVFYLQIPGVVKFSRLEHRPRCRCSIATALQFHGIEKRPARHVVLHMDLAEHHITRLKLHNLIWPCPHWLEVVWRVAGILPLIRGKEVLRQDQPPTAKEGTIPIGRRNFEHYPDSMLVELVDALDVLEVAYSSGACSRVCRILP